MITVEQFKEFCPRSDFASWAPALDYACSKYEITTSLRLCHFLGQTAEESGGYTVFSENLNYSARALRSQWPTHFETDAIAANYARQPEKIANRAYANRYGNGDENSGDGWRYRGRGPIQTTFKAGYIQAAQDTGLNCVANPDLILNPSDGALAAAAYWRRRGCNEEADHDDIVGITKLINGGLINLSTRQAMVAAAKLIWTKEVVGG